MAAKKTNAQKKTEAKRLEQVVDRDRLADSIEKISKAAHALRDREGLNERGVIALLHDYTKLPKNRIKQVLDGLEALEDEYLS